MSDIDRIIQNVSATMEMENMPLTEDNRSMIRNCLEGKISFEMALNSLVAKYYCRPNSEVSGSKLY